VDFDALALMPSVSAPDGRDCDGRDARDTPPANADRAQVQALGRNVDGPAPGISWREALDIEHNVATGALAALERHGHTAHCAARQAHGDGECECGRWERDREERRFLTAAVRAMVRMDAAIDLLTRETPDVAEALATLRRGAKFLDGIEVPELDDGVAERNAAVDAFHRMRVERDAAVARAGALETLLHDLCASVSLPLTGRERRAYDAAMAALLSPETSR
jgi:hypothetical protein